MCFEIAGIMGFNDFESYLWIVCGFILILCLFLFASIPLKDGRMLNKRKQQFETYKNNTSMLIPMPYPGILNCIQCKFKDTN